MTERSSLRCLYELAGLHGILKTCRDAGGRLTAASEESLTRTLSALGAPIHSVVDYARFRINF